MIGRLFQVIMPPKVCNGADWIRVVDTIKKTSEEDDKDDLYFVCRVSREGIYENEDTISVDDFITFYKNGIILDPDEISAAKLMLLGNKI